MTKKPRKQWTCDRCRELIREPSHGMVEYAMVPDPQRARPFFKNFRVVHQFMHSPLRNWGGCSFFSHSDCDRCDQPLSEFLGPDGLSDLLLLLDDVNSPASVDTPEMLKLIRLLHLPQDEEASRYRAEAEGDGLLDGLDLAMFFLQEQLKAVVECYTSDDV